MIRLITISKLEEHFDRLIKQAHRRGARAVITKRTASVAAVVPVVDLARLQQSSDCPPLRVVNKERAREQLHGLVHRAANHTEWVVIEDDGEPVAAVVSFSGLRRLQRVVGQPPRGSTRELEHIVAQEVAARSELR